MVGSNKILEGLAPPARRSHNLRLYIYIVRAELKRRECNAMGHAFVCIRRPFEFLTYSTLCLIRL